MNQAVEEWLLANTTEPAHVVGEYRAYWPVAGEHTNVLVRVLKYLPDALQGANEEYRRTMRYVAEVVTLDGRVLATGNPDTTPEQALDNIPLRDARGESITWGTK